MIKTQVLLQKTIEDNSRVWLRVRFLLFYSELAPVMYMLQTLLGRKKYEEAMSDEHPLTNVPLSRSCGPASRIHLNPNFPTAQTNRKKSLGISKSR